MLTLTLTSFFNIIVIAFHFNLIFGYKLVIFTFSVHGEIKLTYLFTWTIFKWIFLENICLINSQRLRNNFLNIKTEEESRSLYVKQQNRCGSLFSRLGKEPHSNLDEKNATDNRRLWKTVKPLVSDNLTYKKRINLSENGKLLKADTEIAKTQFSYIPNRYWYTEDKNNLGSLRYTRTWFLPFLGRSGTIIDHRRCKQKNRNHLRSSPIISNHLGVLWWIWISYGAFMVWSRIVPDHWWFLSCDQRSPMITGKLLDPHGLSWYKNKKINEIVYGTRFD